VYQKIEKRIPTWQSCLLSYGGKMILTESCLSSMLNYVMGVFHLKGEAHHKMETARSNFFWHGPRQKKKYHMMRWEVLATPKPIGGLGFTVNAFYQNGYLDWRVEIIAHAVNC
jgi:hypothetical protein